MEKHNRKQVLDLFSEKLCQKFTNYCKEHQKMINVENFITYMIDQDLITPSRIKQYAIVEAFQELYADQKNHKTHIVNTLANRFNLTPRSIWNTLRKMSPTALPTIKTKK